MAETIGLFAPPEIGSNGIHPYPYQDEAWRAVDEHIRGKETNPCVCIPTGGGKSLLMAWCIQNWKREHPPFRVIILAHRKELVKQNATELRRLWPGVDLGIYSAGLHKRDIDASITYASIDSVYHRWGEFPPFDVVIVDEAHRIPPSGEGKYRQFINGCHSQNENLRVVGFTATPFRMNSGPICHKDHILHEICYEAYVSNLIADGYLCKLRSKIDDDDDKPDLSGVKARKDDYVTKSLAKVVDTPEVVKKAIRSVVKIINAENRQSVMFFCVDVKHCKNVAQELQKWGIIAPQITAKTKPKDRDRIVEDFKEGRIRAVCNVNVYTEGFNAKRVDCIVLLRPTLSPGLYIQMVGRGLRTHPSKCDCLVLDYAQCIDEHGPIDCIDQGKTKMAKCQNCGDDFSRAIRQCPNCGWVIPPQEVKRAEAEEKEKRMHDVKHSNLSILGSEPEELSVDDVSVFRHRKPGKPDSIRVEYRCGRHPFIEWICLDHGGYAERKARKWWADRFGEKETAGMSIESALTNFHLDTRIKNCTESITVAKTGKHFEIRGYKLKNGVSKCQ